MWAKLSETFSVFFRRLPLFAAIALSIWLPVNLATEKMIRLFHLGDFWVYVWGGLIFGPIVSAATVDVLDRLERGQPAGYLDAMDTAVSVWLTLMLTSLMAMILSALGFVFLIIPGILLMIFFTFVTAVVVVEGLGGMAALARSARLTAGRRWKIFGANLILVLLMLLVFAPVTVVMELTGTIDGFGPSVAFDCLTDLYAILFTILNFLFYWDARVEEESAKHPKQFLYIEPLPQEPRDA
ncbi:MAG: hypothetical protein ABFD69_05025 [Candidatus Sumerlaeia bacterium]